ncbi:MAG TPA: hypothetical protein VKX17_10695 [Planctomycetota bacterium]|nr:hypothetical protein [Planctomycetota bacterium]
MAIYGPFHRLETITQTPDDAKLQVASGEIWGRGYRGSMPQVNAFRGSLPAGEKGIEFYTEVEPDKATVPMMARWTGPRDGVRVEDDFGKIKVTITWNTQ